MAEVFRVGNACWLLDLLKLFVQRLAVEQLAGFRVTVLLVLNPEVGIGHIAVKDVLTVLAVRLEIRGLNLFADEVHVTRGQKLLDEAQVALEYFGRQLLALQRLLQHVQQMHRVGRDFGTIEVEHLGENFEGKAGREPLHTFIDPSRIAVLLNRLGAWVGVLQVLPVIHPHFGVDTGVLRHLEPRQH